MEHVLERLRGELRGRYDVEQELGRGGMAVVYLARDVRHGRRVAVKVLRPDVGGAVTAERFLREIRTAANLQHPHILPVHDSGAAGDLLYYVMPYVEGESLRERLTRGGPLPVEEAVRLARETADALEFAHARGVIHRDIKPENILLQGGHALVADFGIARAASEAGLSTELTEAGVAVGTPAYMSPEQATADPKVDGRSDQYALGCVLYEMLAGTPPFGGPTSQAVMARHARDPVPSLATVRAVPAPLEHVVQRALAKTPADRWPGMRDFTQALEAAMPGRESTVTAVPVTKRSTALRAGAIAAVLLAVGTLAWGALRPGPEAALRLVALAPVSYTGDSTGALYADGLADGLLKGLLRVPGLGVIDRSREPVDPANPSDPVALGRAAKAYAVITASVMVRGNTIRVTPILTNVADGRVLWTDNINGQILVDGQLRDPFSIQDQVTAQIIDALRVPLAPTARAVLARGAPTRDDGAYRLYLEARRDMDKRTPESYGRAVLLLQEAVRRDSAFADAWVSLLTATYGEVAINDRPLGEHGPALRQMVERAIRLDSTNAGAYIARSMLRSQFRWDMDSAWLDLQRAVRLNPGSSAPLWELAYFNFQISGQLDSALHYMHRALALDPSDPGLEVRQMVHAMAGTHDSARIVNDQILNEDPSRWYPYFWRMNLALSAGDRVAADSAADRYLDLGGWKATQAIAYAAVYHHRAGNRARTRQMLDSIEARERRVGYVSAVDLAIVQMSAGERERALASLDRAAAERDPRLILSMPAVVEVFAGEPRFEALRQRIYGRWQGPKPLWAKAPAS